MIFYAFAEKSEHYGENFYKKTVYFFRHRVYNIVTIYVKDCDQKENRRVNTKESIAVG